MLTYKEKHGFGTVSIEPHDDFFYYCIENVKEHSFMVMRIPKKQSTLCDIWCPNEWQCGFKLANMKNTEDLQWILIKKPFSYTVPTRDACLAYENN